MVGRSERRAKQEPQQSSLGKFSNFPIIIHGRAKVTFTDYPAKIQRSVILALYRLNGSKKKYPIGLSSEAGIYSGWVGFEVGIAEGIYFNYLDDEMAKKLYKSITPRSLYPTLDFLIIVTYHYNREGKNVRLNFDYYQIRFFFTNESLEIHLFHSKGIRRMPLDEFLNRILDCLNKEIKENSMRPLTIEEIRVL